MTTKYEDCRVSEAMYRDEAERVYTVFEKLAGADPSFLKIRDSDRGIDDFFDSCVRNRVEVYTPEGKGKCKVEFDTWRSKTKKPIALDFMGTLNDPKAKGMIWGAVQEAIIKNDTEALEASGMTKEQVAHLKQYVVETGCKPMELRDYALAQEGIKKVLGTYCSIGAEAGQLDFCSVYDDVVDFLTIAKALGHPAEIFSTIGAPEGYRGLSQIMLGNHELSEDYQLFLKCFGEECKTAADLVAETVVSKKKKSEPGQAVLEETAAKSLHLYVDDELGSKTKPGVIDDTIRIFGSQQEVSLPVLCRIEREGVKNPGYRPPEEHPGIDQIVVANTLTAQRLLKAVFSR